MVKNLSSNAGEAGLIPGRGTALPRAAGRLSPCPQLLSPHSTTKKKLMCGEEDPMPPKTNKFKFKK